MLITPIHLQNSVEKYFQLHHRRLLWKKYYSIKSYNKHAIVLQRKIVCTNIWNKIYVDMHYVKLVMVKISKIIMIKCYFAMQNLYPEHCELWPQC